MCLCCVFFGIVSMIREPHIKDKYGHQESILAKTKRFFKQHNLGFKLSLLLLITAVAVYAFIIGNQLLRIITILSLSVLTASFVSNYIINYFYGEGFKLADAINEIIFLFLAIPLAIVCAGYLPLSIYVLFFSTENNLWIGDILIGVMIVAQISSFLYLFRRRAKERKMTIPQFIKYLFDFKTRAEEQRLFREQTEQIDIFYTNMEKVRDRVDSKIERSTVGFSEFDWKTGRGIKNNERIEIICFNCKSANSGYQTVCAKCGRSLKGEKSKLS